MAAKQILAQLNLIEGSALTDSGNGFIGFGAKADGLYLKNGAAAELRLLTSGDIGVNVASFSHSHSGYQATLSGTGLVRSTAGVISFDANTYVTGTPWTSMGYLTSQTSHADVLVDGDFVSQGIMLRGATSGTYSILTDNSANWNTAFGWGNHAGLYSLTGHTHSGYQATLSGTGLVKSTAGVISYDTNTYVTGTPWTLAGYLTAITKAQVEAVLTGTISSHSHSLPSHTIQNHSDVYIPVILNGTYSGQALYWAGSNWGLGTPWTSMGYLTSITKAQVEAVLTGAISSHTHSYESTLGNPSVNGYVLSSTTAGVRSWVAAAGGYTLPATGVGTLGGIKLGFSASGSAVPLQTSSDMGFVTVSKASVEYVLTGAISSHTHSYAPINGSSSNAFATANLSVTGTISASSTITGSEVYRGSSRTLKKNIADFDFDAMGFLNDVSIKRYYLKSNNSFGIGFIAEDTHPWLSGDDQKSHVFGNHLGLLTKAIQEEDLKIKEMEYQVLDLQARVKELEIARQHGWR